MQSASPGCVLRGNPDALLISTSEVARVARKASTCGPVVIHTYSSTTLLVVHLSRKSGTTTPTVAQSRVHQYWKLEYRVLQYRTSIGTTRLYPFFSSALGKVRLQMTLT
jgi:hypothetical protein